MGLDYNVGREYTDFFTCLPRCVLLSADSVGEGGAFTLSEPTVSVVQPSYRNLSRSPCKCCNTLTVAGLCCIVVGRDRSFNDA